MSTGLCLGLNLVTKWAVDLNMNACQRLRLNHPETQVRNEAAKDFLVLLKEWEKLCIRFSLVKNDDPEKKQTYCFDMDDEDDSDDNNDNDDDEDVSEVFEVEKILEICYGDPKDIGGERDLYFKVSWKNYGPDYDTWEPISGLRYAIRLLIVLVLFVRCCLISRLPHTLETVSNFVMHGYLSNILPLPGDVDVICGGPTCQGISGFNRFRNTKSPLDDPKNKQLIVFMDTVDFLRPKFVLMENVVDLLKSADGFIGRYAMGCLANTKHQARLGMLGYTVFRSFVCGFFYGVLAQLRSHHNILSPLMMCLGEVSHL